MSGSYKKNKEEGNTVWRCFGEINSVKNLVEKTSYIAKSKLSIGNKATIKINTGRLDD